MDSNWQQLGDISQWSNLSDVKIEPADVEHFFNDWNSGLDRPSTSLLNIGTTQNQDLAPLQSTITQPSSNGFGLEGLNGPVGINIPMNEMHLWEDISQFEIPTTVSDPQLPILNEDPIPLDFDQPPVSALPLTYEGPNGTHVLFTSGEDESDELSSIRTSNRSCTPTLASLSAGANPHEFLTEALPDAKPILPMGDPSLSTLTIPSSSLETKPKKPKKKRNRRRKLASQLSEEELVKTREINRIAAQRHRVIAKARKEEKQKNFEHLGKRNEQLKVILRDTSSELMTLRRLVMDMYGPEGSRAMPFVQSGSNAHELGL